MFWNIFRRRDRIEDNQIVTAVVGQTAALITELNQRMDLRFQEVSAQIKEVELSLAQMETKLLTKDLKDKQAYGLLHYKLHEAKSPKLDDEVKELEEKLRLRKGLSQDQ